MPTDELLIRQMPHSPEAEQAVLGSMLIDADCVKDVMDKLQPEDFYLRRNREIFETIYSMFVYSKPIDGVTVAGEMERAGLSTDDTRSYLVQLMEVTPTSANVMEYVRIVREKALLRAVATAASDITAMVQEGAGEASKVLEAAEQKIYAIRRGRSAQNMVPISVVLQSVLERLGELTAAGGETMPGLTTGFSDLDRKINGLNKSDLLLLAGRPGMGKSALGVSIAEHVAQTVGKVDYFSLEMSREQIMARRLSSLSKVDSKLILMDTLTADEYKRMIEATRKAAATPFYCTNGRAQSAQRITSIARAGRDVKLVVVDHFGLILRPGKRQDADESREIAHALKRLAQSLNQPVLCLAQLNRQNEQRMDKRPTLADLRATGAMEEDADGVIFVHRPDYYQADYKRERGAPERTEVILAKNRHGPTGRLDLSFWPETNTFNPAYVE